MYVITIMITYILAGAIVKEMAIMQVTNDRLT